ncbi:hypothetical protein ACQEVB_21935 [Pseudonocardia sp. CA-107938]|uniref:hypothetical protein n=1 Tax=Pseudonocardia sp. CA-107938 TaxID=3240021 RepID=UPI003D94CAE1
MTKRGPLLTILAVVVLGLGLFTVNMTGEKTREQDTAGTVTAVTGAAAPAATTAAAAAPAAGFPAEAAYAGRTAGNEATIAIAVKDGKAVAYLCDGKQAEAWLEGTATGAALSLTGPDGASLQGTLDNGAVFGRASAKGKEWAFSAATAKAPAGAYRGQVSVAGVTKRIGWTVLQDGTKTGLTNTGGQLSAAPDLDPVTRTATLDGVPVQVTPLTGAQ